MEAEGRQPTVRFRFSVCFLQPSISTNGATLYGNVIPNGLATNAWFQWGTDSSFSTFTSTPSQSIGSGLDSVPVSAQISGLAENTKYYFRVCAANAKGDIEGVITSFTTSSPGGVPAGTTLAATSVGATTATLNGNVTANGLATNAWFEWGTDPSLPSSTSTSSQPIGSGTTSVLVNAALTGLSTGTTYYYRVAASNSSGTTRGSIANFVPGGVPAGTTLAATSVGATTATLNGNVTANGLATNAWFEWGTDPSLASSTSTSSQPIGSGTTSVLVNAALTGLSTGTTYYYRVAASNSSGTTRGSIANFVPGGVPAGTTLAATSVGATTATLNGNVTANGLATNAWFEWGTDPSLASSTSTSSQPIGSGTTSVLVNAALTGLSTGTTYYYRVAASNSSGTTRGSIANFVPGGVPAGTTLAATSVGATTATLNGNVTANGLATNAWFEWGTNPSLASSTSTSSQPIGSGTTSVLVNAALTGLSTGTTYYYRVAASNSSGTTRGSIANFVPGGVPAGTTLAATSVGATTATLNGNVTANGLATNAWFEWGTDPSLASSTSTSSQPIGSGTTSVSVNVPLTGLSTGTTYYYRVAASNSSGTTRGSIANFVPGGVPAGTTLAATSVGATTATLNGNVTANGLATNAWFEWGTNPSLASSTSTSSQPIGSGTTSVLVNVPLTGLSTGTTYYYRINATNSAGTSTGTILSFTFSSHQITAWPENKKGAGIAYFR